jgi:predicted alpha/beta superfamily hydrolase
MRFPCVVGLILSVMTASCAHERMAASSERAAPACAGVRPGTALASPAAPLVLAHGETFRVESAILKENRRINVLLPTVYGVPVEGSLPVLYMPDGGLDEDFLHIAGLVQVLVSNGTMRPVILVGIENTQRRRDMTGPTESAEDRAIAPVVGGSAAFRAFLREELMPTVRERYRCTAEASIVGESLAGLFVLETLFEEPELFQTYIAVDPSVWWNNNGLVRAAEAPGTDERMRGRGVMVVTSGEPSMAQVNAEFAAAMTARCAGASTFTYVPMTSESHGTIYHPAALAAFRAALAPAPKPASGAP